MGAICLKIQVGVDGTFGGRNAIWGRRYFSRARMLGAELYLEVDGVLCLKQNIPLGADVET